MTIFSISTSLVVSTFILSSAYGLSTINCVDDHDRSFVVNSEKTAGEITGVPAYKNALRCYTVPQNLHKSDHI